MQAFCFNCMRETTEKVCGFCGYDSGSCNTEPHQLRPGTMLQGRYRVGRVLGGGGFGITYVGLDTVLDLKVAIKEFYMTGYVSRDNTLSPELRITAGTYGTFFEQNRSRFLDEARVLARFSTEPGIVGVRDCFQTNNTAYIVMDFLSGQTLRDYLKKNGPQDWGRTWRLMHPVLRSMSLIHNHDVIHRDISPDNIMMTDGGEVKLLDFGAAREFSQSDHKSLSVILKPGYAPIEQYSRKGVQGPWTDVYALCATMYHCLTGDAPAESTDRVVGEEIKAPYELGRCKKSVSDVLMRGLALDRQVRWQSVEELIKALERANAMERETPRPAAAAQPGSAGQPSGADAAARSTVYAAGAGRKPAGYRPADPDATACAGTAVKASNDQRKQDPDATVLAGRLAELLSGKAAKDAAKKNQEQTVSAGKKPAPKAAPQQPPVRPAAEKPKQGSAAAPKAEQKAAPGAAQKSAAGTNRSAATKAPSHAASPFTVPPREAPKAAPGAMASSTSAAGTRKEQNGSPFTVPPKFTPPAPEKAAKPADSGKKGKGWRIAGLVLLALWLVEFALKWVQGFRTLYEVYGSGAILFGGAENLQGMESALPFLILFPAALYLSVLAALMAWICLAARASKQKRSVKALLWTSVLLCAAALLMSVVNYGTSFLGEDLPAHTSVMAVDMMLLILVCDCIAPKPQKRKRIWGDLLALIVTAACMILSGVLSNWNQAYLDLFRPPVLVILIVFICGIVSAAKEKKKSSAALVYSYFTCSACKQVFRVPAGKGHIKVICPKCGKQYDTNT